MPKDNSPTVASLNEIQCAKCGACIPVCPIYKSTGRETLTARGRLHLLSKLTNPKSPEFNTIFSKCLLCGACRKICPRGIDIPATIIEARSKHKHYKTESFKKKLIRHALSKPKLLKTVTSFTKLPTAEQLTTLPKNSGLHLRLAGLDLSFQAPTNSFIDSHANSKPDSTHNTILYFTGCLSNHLATNIAESSTSLLKEFCHHAAIIPKDQNCCGMAGLSAGDQDQAKVLAKKNIEAFCVSDTTDLPIFTSCSTCFSALRNYPELFKDDTLWHEKAVQFAKRVWEFSTFLTEHWKNKQPKQPTPDKTNQPKVFYHDPCHLRFGHPDGITGYQPITSAPRELIMNSLGINPLELPKGPQCCGQGGLFHLSHPTLSGTISNSLVDNFNMLNADFLVTTCSGCLLQWKTILKDSHSNVKAMHLAEFLSYFLSAKSDTTSL